MLFELSLKKPSRIRREKKGGAARSGLDQAERQHPASLRALGKQVCSTVLGNDRQPPRTGRTHTEARQQHPVLYAFLLEDPPELHTPRPCQVQVFSPLLLCWEAIALTRKGTAVVQWALFIHAQPLFHCTVLVL